MGGISGEQFTLKPIYEQHCTSVVVGYETVFSQEYLLANEFAKHGYENPFSKFDRDSMLPPEGWTWVQPQPFPGPSSAPPSEVAIPGAAVLFGTMLIVVLAVACTHLWNRLCEQSEMSK